jgi:hypothetical protein
MLLTYLRSFRLGDGSALFDYVSTIAGSVVIAHYTKIPIVLTTVSALTVGEILHYIFRIKSRTLNFLISKIKFMSIK